MKAMRISTLINDVLGFCLALAILSGCNAPATSALSPSVGQGNSASSAGSQMSVRHTVKQIMIPGNSCCVLAVDPKINQIYVSSGVNLSGNETTVVDGKTFSVIASVSGFGGANSVDSHTHNVWLAGLYSGEVEVYSGLTRSGITTVSLGYCPIGSWIDSKRRHAWVSAQCGSGSDPVWALDADTYKVIAGPIHTGGVMSPITPVNPVTGRLYGNNSSGNFEINPYTFDLTPTSFGVVLNVDAATNLLYARVTNGLNIVTGWSEKIKKTVTLSYTPSFVGVNSALNHIYTGSGQDSIEVREGNTGRLLGTVRLKGSNVVTVAASHARGFVYATGASGSSYYLYEFRDNF